MSAKKLIVVFGATGGQGGSVVKSLLENSQFSIRAITRDLTKPAAKALEAKGCEVVNANLDDKSSLLSALHGAYGAFVVTNFWEKTSAEVETSQGKNVADAAKENNVQHLVWSSLPNVTKLSKGALTTVLHFDSKAHVEEYIRSIGIPATFFMPGFFMSNLTGGMIRQDPSTKTYSLSLPIPADSPIPLLDTADDTGKFVKGIFTHRDKTLGKQIYAATAYMTPAEIIDTFKQEKPELAKGASFQEISPKDFKKSLGYAGMQEVVQDDLLGNMLLMPRFGYYFGADLEESHSIVDEPLTTWKEYINKSKVWASTS